MSADEETRPLDDGSAYCFPTALSLGRDICDRYSASPGILISPDAFSLARKIVSFGINRLPLLESIQTRFDASRLVPDGWLGLQYVWRTTRFAQKPSTPIALVPDANRRGILESGVARGHITNSNLETAVRESQSLPFSSTQPSLGLDAISPITEAAKSASLLIDPSAADAEEHKQANPSLASRSGPAPIAGMLAPASERDKSVGPPIPRSEQSITRHLASSSAPVHAPSVVHRHKMPVASAAPSLPVATVKGLADGRTASAPRLQGDTFLPRPASAGLVPTRPEHEPSRPMVESNPDEPGRKPSPVEHISHEIMQRPIFARGRRNLPSHEIQRSYTSSSSQTVAPDQILGAGVIEARSACNPSREDMVLSPASVVGASPDSRSMARPIAIHDVLGPHGEASVVHRSATSPTRGLQMQIFSPPTAPSPISTESIRASNFVGASRVSPSRFSSATLTHRLPSTRDPQTELPQSRGSIGANSGVRAHTRNNHSSATSPSRFELPAISAASAEAKTAAADTQQLANRVYDLLVKRLASERQRRGF
jgi:hypothetical protein